MNERSLPLLPIGVLALLVILTFWLSRFVQTSPARSDAKLRHDPDLIVERFAARKLSVAGEVQYKLHAEQMVHFADDDSSKISSVLFTSVQPGRPPLTASAPLGDLYNRADTIVLSGNVVVVNEASDKLPSYTLKTPILTLETDKNLAYSDSGVTVDSANSHLAADKLLLNTDKRTMKLQRVTGSLQRMEK